MHDHCHHGPLAPCHDPQLLQNVCRVAKFLETRGLTEKALEVAQDADYRFELALQLDNVDVAVEIAEELGSETRWKQLGELALADGKLALAERCLNASSDLSGMLLMHSATGNREGMQVFTTSVAARIFGRFGYVYAAVRLDDAQTWRCNCACGPVMHILTICRLGPEKN